MNVKGHILCHTFQPKFDYEAVNLTLPSKNKNTRVFVYSMQGYQPNLTSFSGNLQIAVGTTQYILNKNVCHN